MGAGRARIAGAIGVTTLVAGLVIGVPTTAQAVVTPSAAVVIDEVYGAGGNAGAVVNRDFIELYNTGATTVSLTGWAVQYKSATGTTWARTLLSGSIPAHGFLTIGEGNGGTNGAALPSVNISGTISMGATSGTVALTSTTTTLTCTLATCATTPSVIDLVGYGATSTTHAGASPAPAPSTTLSVARTGWHKNTANNAADFFAETPTPGAASAPKTLSSVLADVTTAYTGGSYVDGVYVGSGPDPTTGRADPSQESTLGNLVANFLVATLSSAELGGAGIGVINPAALRGELLLAPDGVVTDVEGASLLTDTNPLYTLRLTGAQFTTMLEQQWRPGGFIALGLSENVTYTYDPAAPVGSHVTSVTIDDTPVDPAGIYRIGTTAYLASGGDGFDIFAQGDHRQATALQAQQSWLEYLGSTYGLEANYGRQGVQISDVPTTVAVGGDLSFSVSGLDLTSLGAPQNTRMAVNIDGDRVVQVPVSGGAAEVSVTVPEWLSPGSHLLTLRAKPSGTLVTLPFVVQAP